MPRNWRASTLIVGASSTLLLLWKLLFDPAPLLLWNASKSIPLGFYRIEKRAPDRGEIAVLRLPDQVGSIANERRYLPRSAWFLKPVAASRGAVVCRFGPHVFVEGKVVARAKIHDRNGRLLPIWKGCQTLKTDEVFLLAKPKESFDSRYFGPIDRSRIIGTAIAVSTH
jgi:conjugative transfer signal peptidase TraF